MTTQEFTTEELANEIWKPVVGYEGLYSVSDLGRIMRMGGSPRCKTDRLLKTDGPTTTGYLSVSLSANNVVKRRDVHVLVARAFIGPCPEGHNVNHKDTIKTNGRLSNLEYTTFQGNTQHALAAGVMATGDRNPSRQHPERLPHGDDHWSHQRPQDVRRGETHTWARLTEADVRAIRKRYPEGGITQRQMADDYGVTVMTINCVLLRKTWAHVHP